MDELKRKKMMANIKRDPSSKKEDNPYKKIGDQDFYHEEDPMGQTVVQGQQSEEWKKENPFQAAQFESQKEVAEKKSMEILKKRFNKKP